MKKVIFVLIAIIMGFAFVNISVSFAEEKVVGKSIFEYKKELALTDKQEKNLHEILNKLQSNLGNKQKEFDNLKTELNKLIREGGDLDKIKAKLNSMAKIQAEASYEDIASTRAIETELTGVQLGRWQMIQAEYANNLKQAQESASKTKEIKETKDTKDTKETKK
jgi:hypothetical protein